MSDILKLTIPWTELQSKLEKSIIDGRALNSIPASKANEFEELLAHFSVWDKEATTILKESFSEDNQQLTNEFGQITGGGFTLPGQSPSFHQQVSDIKNQIRNKINFLVYNERILNVCDAIVRPQTINLEERTRLTLKQKQTLILEKLYELYDNFYYPVEEILKGNGVKLNRFNEADDLVTSLENKGLVEGLGGKGTQASAKLSMNGAMFIEESREPAKENYDDIKFSQEEMAQKIDELKEKLNEVGLGNEILFDELQEMKELYRTLNKKNWGQLLKGKLVDIAIGKLVENDTISYIYEHLTHHTLKLL